MKSIFNVIRAELCQARKGDDSELKDSVLFRRRSAASVDRESHVLSKRTFIESTKKSVLHSSLNSTFGIDVY